MAKLPGFFEGTEMPAAGWWEALWPSPATVLAAVGISSRMNVIDLCCGDGWFTLQIAKEGEVVLACALAPPLLDVARLRRAEKGVTNCDFLEGDAYTKTNANRYLIHFCFPAESFHGIPDKPRMAR